MNATRNNIYTVDFLYMFYSITVCVMGFEPATEIN